MEILCGQPGPASMETMAFLNVPPAALRPMFAKLAGTALMGVLLFGAAGHVAWPQGWTFLALWGVASIFPDLALARDNPSLLRRRAIPRATEPTYERVLKALHGLLLLAIPVLAGLDAQRFEWSPLPTEIIYGGTLLVLMGGVGRAWAMVENPHYEPTMRIQRDIGHKVIYNGPYRIVRHPGYLASIVQAAGIPLVLGSPWCAIPTTLIAVVLVIRSWFEDRTLIEDLKGYTAYARQVPTLLFPGLW